MCYVVKSICTTSTKCLDNLFILVQSYMIYHIAISRLSGSNELLNVFMMAMKPIDVDGNIELLCGHLCELFDLFCDDSPWSLFCICYAKKEVVSYRPFDASQSKNL